MSLRSTKDGVDPLEIYLDDAELIDHTKCFDQFRNDKRILVDFSFAKEKPLKRSELGLNRQAFRSFFFPLIGAMTIALSSLAFLTIPLDNSNQKESESKIEYRNKQ